MTVEEVLREYGAHGTDLLLVHPDDREHYEREAYENIKPADGHLDVEYRIIRLDGDVRHIHEIGETDYDEDGRAVRTHGAARRLGQVYSS